MTVTFREEDHSYWKDGRRLPSVTQALSDICSAQYAGVSPERMAAAALRGNKVDRIVQDACNGTFNPEDHDFDLLPYYDAWTKFLATSGFRVTGVQNLVHSERHGYAGQLDVVGFFPKHHSLSIVDVKNTFAVMPSAGPQTAGYAIAYAEQAGVPRDDLHRYVLHFKNDACTLKPLTKKTDFTVFLAALTVHKFKAGEL